MSCIGLFYILAHLGVSLGVLFFIWVGIFNLMIPSQFWAFANEICTKDEGERLFPVVQFGANTP